MITEGDLWVTGCVAFIGGVIIGSFICKAIIHGFRNRGLKEQLDTANANLQTYQNNVNNHFNTTAHLINKMTESVRDIHEHMSNSAETLCQDVNTKTQINDALLGANSMLSGDIEHATSLKKQPKDYAPYHDKNTVGTLSEKYSAKK